MIKYYKKSISICILFIKIMPLIAMDGSHLKPDEISQILERLSPPPKPIEIVEQIKRPVTVEILKQQFNAELTAQPFSNLNLQNIAILFYNLAKAYKGQVGEQDIINHLRLCNASLLAKNANLQLTIKRLELEILELHATLLPEQPLTPNKDIPEPTTDQFADFSV